MAWREVRAGLIACAIVLGLVQGCPIPPPHETLPWQERYVSVIRPVQTAIMTPFAWFPKFFRVTERFALFQAAEPERYRFEITVRTSAGVERVVFRALDDAHQEDADVVAQRRVRGVWNPTDHPTSQYGPFTKWFARRVFAREVDAQVVLFRMQRVIIVDGTPHDTGTYAFEVAHYRGAP